MANSTNLSNHQANVSKPSGSDDLQYIEYPYFENLTGISQWVQNDMLDTSSKIPEFYSETNETGNLTDMTHNFEDFGVALDGLLPATIYNGYDYLLPDYFLSQEQTPFYDSNSSSQGFYTTTSGDWTQNSTEESFNSMAQSVVTFVDWLDQNNVNVFDADKAVTTEYGLLNNLFCRSHHSSL